MKREKTEADNNLTMMRAKLSTMIARGKEMKGVKGVKGMKALASLMRASMVTRKYDWVKKK